MTTLHEELHAFLRIHTYMHAFIHTHTYLNHVYMQCIYIHTYILNNTYIILDPNYLRSNTLLFIRFLLNS
jgi:hypothetical protein